MCNCAVLKKNNNVRKFNYLRINHLRREYARLNQSDCWLLCLAVRSSRASRFVFVCISRLCTANWVNVSSDHQRHRQTRARSHAQMLERVKLARSLTHYYVLLMVLREADECARGIT